MARQPKFDGCNDNRSLSGRNHDAGCNRSFDWIDWLPNHGKTDLARRAASDTPEVDPMRTCLLMLAAAATAVTLIAAQENSGQRPPIELPPLPAGVRAITQTPVIATRPQAVPASEIPLELPSLDLTPPIETTPAIPLPTLDVESFPTAQQPAMQPSTPIQPLPPTTQPADSNSQAATSSSSPSLGFEAEPGYQPMPEPFQSGIPASVPRVTLGFSDVEQNSLVQPYLRRTSQMLDDADDLGLQSVTEVPGSYTPWWADQINAPLRSRGAQMGISFDEVILSALTHSARVKALRVEPTIRRQSVTIEDAAFDWLQFAEMTWDDTSDPVGNTLTTGGSPRFRDHRWNLENGLRRRTRSGGEFEISNQIGWQDNNSEFFVPAPQGTSRLSVSFTQPLLRARGRFYNTSRIVLAQIDTGIAASDTLLKLQDHLVEVSQVYWELYRARASLLQKRRLLERATTIYERLEGRRGVDVLQRQILRARAAVASRRSEIARAAATVRNSEARLRLLVNDPALLQGRPLELIPADAPLVQNLVYSTPETVTVGLMTRPDIAKSIREIRQQSVRLGVSRAELLPKLDLILSGYVAGLEDRGDIWESTRNWWQQGEPGYSVGFQFEYPLGNRAARALVEQQQFRLRKSFFEFRNTVETGITEIELAVREARTSYAEMSSRLQSMRSAEAETDYLQERWKELPGDDRSTAELLEDLLDAQERVATEEFAFETARLNYMLSLIEIKRSTGTLLATENGNPLLNRPTRLSGRAPVASMPTQFESPAINVQPPPRIGIPLQPDAMTLPELTIPSQPSPPNPASSYIDSVPTFDAIAPGSASGALPQPPLPPQPPK